MKKISLFIIVIALIFFSCENKSAEVNCDATKQYTTESSEDNSAEKARVEATAKDTAETAASEKAQAEAAKKDSLYKKFHTADLNAFFLHGRVKQVTDESNNGYSITFTFNKNGELTSYTVDGIKCSIERVGGKLSNISGGSSCADDVNIDYIFDKQNRLIKFSEAECHYDCDRTYKGYKDWLPSSFYDKLGNHGGGGFDEGIRQGKISFSNFDEIGNFRIYQFNGTYDCTCYPDNEEPFDKTEQYSEKFSRKIIYYSPKEVGL